MRTKNLNLILAGVAALLGAAIWFSPGPEPPESRYPPLTPVRASEVGAISLLRGDTPRVRLKREAGGWQMVEPYPTEADGAWVARLLEVLEVPSLERFPVEGLRLQEFALAPPRAVLEVDSYRLEFGGTHPYDPKRYVRVGDTLHAIRDRFPHLLLARAEEMISPRPLPPGLHIDSLSTPRWRLHRESGGPWRLEPVRPGLPRQAMERKIRDWENVRADRVLPAPAEPDAGTLHIVGAGGTRRFTLGVVTGDRGGILLVRRDLGLAYRLAEGTDLLEPPG